MQGLGKSLNLTDEKINQIVEQTNKTIAEIPGIQAKSSTASSESEMYAANKILAWITALARAVASFM